MKKTRVGVIGLGWFGNFHLDYLLTRKDIDVTAIASTNQKSLRRTGEKVPGAKQFENPEELLNDGCVDVVLLCIPPHKHNWLEIQAANKGIHLYIEKPLGIDLIASRRTQEVIESTGVVCAVGYQCRYQTGVDEMRRYLSDNTVGLIQGSWIGEGATSLWWRDRNKSGGQVVEQTTHFVDLMRYMVGEAQGVFGVAQNVLPMRFDGATVDGGSITTVRFKSGTIANLTCGCFNKPGKAKSELSLHFYCQEAEVKFDWNCGMYFITEQEEKHFEPSVSSYQSCMDTFLDAIKTGDDSKIRSSYGDAIKTLSLTLAIEESIRTGNEVMI